MTEPNPTKPTNADAPTPRCCSAKRAAVSALILACLGLQLSVFVPGIDALLPHFPYYPFVKYNMYADSHTGVPTTTRSEVQATLAGGDTVPCMPKDIGLTFFVWRYHYVEAMKSAEHDRGVARSVEAAPGNEAAWEDALHIAERAARVYGKPVTAVHITTTTYRLLDDGLDEAHQPIRFLFAPAIEPGDTEGSGVSP